MNIKDILSYKLIELEHLNVTVLSILMILLSIFIAWAIMRTIKRLLNNKRTSAKLDIGQRNTIYQLIKYLVYIITIAIILESLGVKITLLVAGSAALLVGLGLGIQQLFNDIVSGLILLFERSLTVDEIIEVDGMVAKVKEIGLRTSSLETRDNIIIIVPNSKLVSNSLINWSHNKKYTRFRVGVGVAYGSDVQLVKSILYECAINHPDITSEMNPIVRFTDFADSSLNFEVLFWTNNMFMIENVKSDLRFAIDKAFHEKGIQIPFPQQDVYIKQFPGK